MRKVKILLICIAIVLAVISLSETLTLRTAVFLHSPKSAVTSQLEDISDSRGESLGKYYILSSPPVDRQTQNKLTTWAVISIGPFHYAYYYGEG